MEIAQVQAAVDQLARSGRGENVLRGLLVLLDDHGAISLDQEGQRAVMVILSAAWGKYPGSARDLIREKIGVGDPE